MVDIPEREAVVHPDHDPMGTLGKRIFADADQCGTKPCPAQDVIGAKGLDILETVSKENVYAFHIRKIINFAFVKIGKLWKKRNCIPSGSPA
jgi:hypothetical protein